MDEQEDIWFGIRPRMGVVGVSGAGVSPIVITTSTQMLAGNGDRVSVEGVRGNSAANMPRAPVTNRPAPIWFLDTGLKQISVENGVATVELTVPHGLVPGQVVHIHGSTDDKLGKRDPNVYHAVSTIPSATTFTVAAPGAANGVYTTDRTMAERLAVRVLPSFSVPGTGSGDYTGAGSVVSVEEFRSFTEIHLRPFTPEGLASSPESPRRGSPITVRPPRAGRGR
jgi:hypothetical protein